jgi:hypothetical protein
VCLIAPKASVLMAMRITALALAVRSQAFSEQNVLVDSPQEH